MTDLQNMIAMFAKSDETFEKAKSGDAWTLLVTSRDVKFYFNADGSYRFCCKD